MLHKVPLAIFLSFILLFSIVPISDVDAKKSSGTPLKKTSQNSISKIVCGDKLCSEIKRDGKSDQQSRFSIGGVAQQAANRNNDSDKDGIPNDRDNCPDVKNKGQKDWDQDGIGNKCDADFVDSDNDGIPDNVDNCPNVKNKKQRDKDEDGIGNKCDSESLTPAEEAEDVEPTSDEDAETQSPTTETQSTQSYVGKIVFVSNRDGGFEIYIMNSDGTGVTKLTDNQAIEDRPSLTPDGKIIFSSPVSGNYEIFIMNSDGTGVTKLTDNNTSDYAPSFTPDGKIIFISNRDSADSDIYIMNSDGTEVTKLTNTNNQLYETSPHLSPDGKIVFANELESHFEIYIMNSDGTGVTKLTDNTSDRAPSFTPDGKIIFSSTRDGSGIFIMNPDGTEVTKLTDMSSDYAPSFTPDGKIIFSSPVSGNHEIYIMNSDGTGVTKLTDNQAVDKQPNYNVIPQTSTETSTQPSTTQTLPTLYIGELTGREGTGTGSTFRVTISLSAPSTSPVTFQIKDTPGTATSSVNSPTDYDYRSNPPYTATIPAGDTSFQFSYGVTGDSTPEPNETFIVTISNPTGATISRDTATVTIKNDDATQKPILSIGDATFTEGQTGTGGALLTVKVSSSVPAPPGGIPFEVKTVPVTATQDSDYGGFTSPKAIKEGEYTALLTGKIYADNISEQDETFKIIISSKVAKISDGEAIITIKNVG